MGLESEREPEPYAWAIGSSSSIVRFLQKLQLPVLALGERRIHNVVLRGHGFRLPVTGQSDPLVGFYLNVWVPALDVRESEVVAKRKVTAYWNDFGYARQAEGKLALEVEEIHVLEVRFVRRWRTGLGFYASE